MRWLLFVAGLLSLLVIESSAESYVDSEFYAAGHYIIQGEALTCGPPAVLHDLEYLGFRGLVNGIPVEHAYLGWDFVPGDGTLEQCSQSLGTQLWGVYLDGWVAGVGYE